MEGEDQPHKFLFLHRATKFAALRMLRISRAYVFYTRHVLESVAKFVKKTRGPESVFNKLKLATVFKKRL